MKISQWLRGRANAFKLDGEHVKKALTNYDGDDDRLRKDMQSRIRAYKIITDELNMLAAEVEREAQ